MVARLAISAACVLMVVGTAAAQAPSQAEAQKVSDAFTGALSKGDGAAAAALFAKDGDYVSSTGRTAQGAAEIEKLVKEQAAGAFKGMTFKTTVGPVRSITPDVAIGNGKFESTGPTPRKGMSTMVLVREGKEWKIAALRAMVPAPAGK